jgi:hypothetical protein
MATETAATAAPWILDTDNDWLLYHADCHALVCSVHGHAILNLPGHLRDKHRALTRAERKAIAAKFAGLDIRRPSKDDFRHGPSNPRQPIKGLPAHRGYTCDKQAGCKYLTRSYKTLRLHHNAEHGFQGSKHKTGPRAPTVWMQTFFVAPKSDMHYFCITAPDGAGDGDDAVAPVPTATRGPLPAIVDDIKRRWAADQAEQEELSMVLAADGASRHEVTNWLKRAGWSVHFAGRHLGDIHRCSRMPGPEEDELLRLVTATDRMFFDRCVDGIKSMPLMSRLLLASPHPNDSHSRPFGPLQEKSSMDRNLGYWKRFLCYCLRVLPLTEADLLEGHGFSFTAGQRRDLKALWTHLQDGVEEEVGEEGTDKQREARLDAELGDKILAVSASFWMQRLSGDPFESPL